MTNSERWKLIITLRYGITKKCLDVRRPEEVFEVAVVRRGLFVVPRTGKNDLGGARLDFFVIPMDLVLHKLPST